MEGRGEGRRGPLMLSPSPLTSDSTHELGGGRGNHFQGPQEKEGTSHGSPGFCAVEPPPERPPGRRSSEGTDPDVLEFIHRGLGQRRRQQCCGGPSRPVLPGDEQQLVADGSHDPQLPAVVSIDGIQVAAWQRKQPHEPMEAKEQGCGSSRQGLCHPDPHPQTPELGQA